MSHAKEAMSSRDRILDIAAGLFAERGYAAVSMRDVGTALKMTPASLYYHFNGKIVLYQEVLASVFSEGAEPVRAIVASRKTPDKKFEAILIWFATLLVTEKNFARLLHRELLDGDKGRLQFLAKEVFQGVFNDILKLEKEIAPDSKPGKFAIQALSFVLGYFEISDIRKHLRGAKRLTDDPTVFGRDAAALLLHGVNSAKSVKG
jgi:AcrR family transcriptional regulator